LWQHLQLSVRLPAAASVVLVSQLEMLVCGTNNIRKVECVQHNSVHVVLKKLVNKSLKSISTLQLHVCLLLVKRQLKENERKVGRITRVITCVCLLLVKLQLKENERKFKKITIATGWCEN
jgi:hypothetical protein